jgi:hypothetical protein
MMADTADKAALDFRRGDLKFSDINQKLNEMVQDKNPRPFTVLNENLVVLDVSLLTALRSALLKAKGGEG